MIKRTVSNTFPALALVCLSLTAFDAHAINKCVDKSGKVTYQEDKCPATATERVLTPPGAYSGNAASKSPAGGAKSPAADGPAADDPREDKLIVDLISIQAGYEGCVSASPGFDQRHGALYATWRANNGNALSRLEGSPRYQSLLERGRRQMRDSTPPSMQKEFANFCETRFIPAWKNNLRR